MRCDAPTTENAVDAADELLALQRCRNGDVQAFGIVVTKYMRRAYFTALGILGNHSDAREVSQEANTISR